MRDVEIEPSLEPVDQRRVSRREAVLQVVMPQILQGRRIWRVTERLGATRFTAQVDDSDFLARVERGEIAFRKGDCFRVRLRTAHHIEGGKLYTSHRILKVLEVFPDQQQLDLF